MPTSPGQPISIKTLKRLPHYLDYLKSPACQSLSGISSGRIADALALTEIQVRKDLAGVSGSGRPRLGYDRRTLIAEIESFLGYDNVDRAVLAGAGRLGQALLHYEGLHGCGVEIFAAFDSDPEINGREINGIRVLNISRMEELIKRLNIHIGIIAVPSRFAQEICDMMVGAGILAVWNFAPLLLKAPENILIQNEDMTGSLTLLSHHLAKRMAKSGQ